MSFVLITSIENFPLKSSTHNFFNFLNLVFNTELNISIKIIHFLMIKSVKYLKNRKKRRKMTFDEVFSKNKYRSIFYLILWSNNLNKKITLHHLKYVLVKNHGGIDLNDKRIKKNLENFFKIHVKEEIARYYLMLYKIGEITKSELDKILSKNVLNELEEYGWVTEKAKFSTVQNLNNYLSRIRQLGLIKVEKRTKKGYPNYRLTKLGIEKYQKFYLKFLIDKCPVEKLDQLIKQYNKITREV